MNKQAQITITRMGITAILLFGGFACALEGDEVAEQVEDRAVSAVSEDVDMTDPDAIASDAIALTNEAEAEAVGTCATMFEHINFAGDRREIDNGAIVSWIGGPWNDQVSSMWIRSGCVLNAYEHINFGGAHQVFLGAVPWVGDSWNDRISSYTCSC